VIGIGAASLGKSLGPAGAADPDGLIVRAGGNYVEPVASDLRKGVVVGAGAYTVSGTLLPAPVVAAAADLAQAIVARFEADAWLGNVANVAGGISYHEAVEKDPDWPHVTFSLSANYDHHAAGQVEDWKLQFDVFSDKRSAGEVDGILDQLQACFNGAELLVTGRENAIAPAVAMRTAYKDGERRWQGVMVFELAVE
jgi:hypothetical protein